MKLKWTTIFEDDHLMAINKPSGLLTLPDRYKPDLPNIYTVLQQSQQDFFMVHRLDRETSGLLIVAKNAEAHKALNAAFEQHQVEKSYLALLEGHLIEDITLDNLLKKGANQKVQVHPKEGKRSISHFKVSEKFKGYTLCEVNIETGRTHQIRVHASFLGHPIVADPIYGSGEALTIQRIKPKVRFSEEGSPALMARTALHAFKMKLEHPFTHEMISLTAEPPKDLKASLNQLRKWRKIQSK